MLLLAAGLAHAGTDIGSEHKIGAGLATGSALINGTAKFYLTDKAGVAVYAGTSFTYHDIRGAWQSEFVHWGDNWSWGQLGLYWHADANLGFYTVPTYPLYPRFGVGGGVGATLQWQKIPLEVFTEGGLGIYPVHGYCGAVAEETEAATGVDVSGICWVGGFGAAGVRWYF